MKLHKRCLAAWMAILLMLTLIPFGTAFAEEIDGTVGALTDIDENTTVGKAVGELGKLGIINGYEDGTFRPDNTITRGEIAKIIITFMGQAEIAYDTLPSGFADVDGVNHWAKKYVKLAADQKIVNGYPDGTFMADHPVKYTEIVKMLVCMLGYGRVAESRTSEGSAWYAGYINVAAEEGILKNAAVNAVEDYASRGTVAILTYNCLDVVPAMIDASGNTIVGDGQTALEKFLGKSQITGVVTGISQTGLTTGNTGLDKREITVKTKDGEKMYQVPDGVDTMRLLGRKIKAYTQKGDDGEIDEISRITVDNTESWEYKPGMHIQTLREDRFAFYSSDDALTTVLFDDLSVIYNGKYDSTFTLAEIEALNTGSIVFICHDGDGMAEVALVTVYETFVVNSAEKLKNPPRIYGKYGKGELLIPLEERNYHFSLTKADGTGEAKAVVDSLAEWNVISVLRSKETASGQKVWKGVVSTATASGKIIEKDESSVKIGDKVYTISNAFRQYEGAKPALNTGEIVTVYLDSNGEVAGAKAASEGESVYLAYIVNADQEQGVDGKARVRFYGITGKTKEQTLFLARNGRVDGVAYNNAGKAITALKEAAAIANAGKSAMGVISTEYSQLIRYSVNADGEINMIDTIMPSSTPGEEDLVLSIAFPNADNSDTAKKLKHEYSGRFVDGNNQLVVNATSATKVLEVPKDVTKLEKYANKTYSSAFASDTKYQIEAYNLNSTNMAKYIISFIDADAATATITENSPFVITKTVSTGLEDNMPIDKVSGYAFPGGSDGTNLLSDSASMFSGKYYLGDIFRYASADGKVLETQQLLKRGTVKPEIYNLKTGAEITAPIAETDPVAAANQAKSQRIFKLDDVSREDRYSLGRFVFGTVIGLDDGQIAISPTTKADACGIQPDVQDVYDIKNATVYLYDYTANKDTDKVAVGASLENIDTYKKLLESSALNPDSASQVLLYHGNNRTVKAIIIFKY